MRELKTQEEFEKVLSDAGDKPVFVDFSAGWCGPCKRIGPKFEDFSKEFTAAEFYKVKKLPVVSCSLGCSIIIIIIMHLACHSVIVQYYLVA